MLTKDYLLGQSVGKDIRFSVTVLDLLDFLYQAFLFLVSLVHTFFQTSRTLGKSLLRVVWKRELGWKGLSLINYWIFHDTPMNFHSMTQIIIHPKKKKTQIIKISCLKSVGQCLRALLGVLSAWGYYILVCGKLVGSIYMWYIVLRFLFFYYYFLITNDQKLFFS